jgi:pectate lyase
VAALVSAVAGADKRDLGRETLAPGDGWGSFSTGTTGGAAADTDHVYVVHDRQELVAALANRSATPKIIRPDGV